jgi:hypothetical protein
MPPLNKSDLIADISSLQRTKILLELYASQKITDVSISFFCEIEGVKKFISLNQSAIPFSLHGELNLLLVDSVTELDRQINSLTQQLK